MNHHEHLEQALTETIFWHDIAQQVLGKDPKHDHLKKRIEHSFPRVLYEASFLTGNREWYDQALARDHSLAPQERSSITTIKVEKNKGDKNSISVSEPITFTKEPEYIAWQRWHSTGLNSERYPHTEFPTFFERVLVYINDGVGKLRTNNQLELGGTGGVNAEINEIQQRLPYLILSKSNLPDVCGHRYEYELLFEEFVADEMAEQITGIPYHEHR